MSLKRRFLLVSSVAMAIFASLSLASIRAVEKLEKIHHFAVFEAFPFVIALEDFRYSALRVVSSTSEYGFVASIGMETDEDKDTPDARERESDEVSEASIALIEALGAMEEYVGQPGLIDAAEYEELSSLASELLKVSLAVRTAIDGGFGDAETETQKERLEDLEESMLSQTNSLIAKERQLLQVNHELVDDSIQSNIGLLMSLTFAYGFMFLALLLLIGRTVLNPVAELSRAMAELSKGDFSRIPHSDSKDEVGELTASFGRMARTLQLQMQEKEAALSAARENEVRFRMVADAASDWIWETDAEHRFSFLSDRFSVITGIPVESALGRPLSSVLKPEIPAPMVCRGSMRTGALPGTGARSLTLPNRSRRRTWPGISPCTIL